mgnify:CR=1 FL=1
MIRILHLLFVSKVANTFTIDFPYKTNFMTRIKDIDLRNLNDQTESDLKYLFKTTPVLVFQDQKLTPAEQLSICKLFDNKSTDEVLITPFKKTQIPDVPQICIRGQGYTNHFGLDNVEISNYKVFRYTPVWHQDGVGSDMLPPIVSSMYMIKSPESGGYTSFASLENAYESMTVEHRHLCTKLESVYSSYHALTAEIDFTGYGRLDRYWEHEFPEGLEAIVQPLIVYPTPDANKKCFMLSPNKFYAFSNSKPYYSQDHMRYIMRNYILTPQNVGELHYKKGDLVIFNNRRVMHTSSPMAEYNDERFFSLLFLGTKTPFLQAGDRTEPGLSTSEEDSHTKSGS